MYVSAHRRYITGRSASQARSRLCTIRGPITAMAVAVRTEERLLRQFWGSGNLTHRQCMKNLLQLMEVGDIDPKIPGLPLQPKKDRFEYKHLNK